MGRVLRLKAIFKEGAVRVIVDRDRSDSQAHGVTFTPVTIHDHPHGTLLELAHVL